MNWWTRNAIARQFIESGPLRGLLFFFVVGVVLVAYRLAFGLGAATNLNDGYPWGLWIAADVVTGTALATGGYAVAMLVYILNRGKYHPLVRPALLTSALGYTLAGIAISLDVGKSYGIFKIPIMFWHWNLNSVLLEVALCIVAYTHVLWLELMPGFLDHGRAHGSERIRSLSERLTPIVERVLPWVICLGILLPTMHQSGLGSLMLLAGPRLHPLWNTPWLPMLFLASCIGMGYAAVVFESVVSSRLFGHKPDVRMLSDLAGAIVPLILFFTILRLGDLAWNRRLGLLFATGEYGVVTMLETALFLAPLAYLWPASRRANMPRLFKAAMLIMLAGGFYRFNTYLLAFTPGDNYTYFPSVTEVLITAGLFSFEILAFVYLVQRFPALGGHASAPEASRPAVLVS